MIAAHLLWIAGQLFTGIGDRLARRARRRADLSWGGRLWRP